MSTLSRLPSLLRLCLCAVLAAPGVLAAGPIDDLAAQTWIQAESRHFKIVTDQPEATARRLLTDLETLRYISTRVRGVETVETAPPLTILAVGGRNSFSQLGLRETVGGVFNISRHGYSALANVAGYVSRTNESMPARTILLHEYHHFLMRLTPVTLAMPMWYDEGMAEYWSSLTIEGDQARFGRPVDGMHREYHLSNAGGEFTMDTAHLFGVTKLKFDDTRASNDEIGSFYAQARYAIHYFQSTRELRAQLERYITLYNSGIGQQRAAQLAFGKTYPELDKEIVRYLNRKIVVRGFKIGMGGLELPPIDMAVRSLDRRAVWATFAQVLPRYAPMNKELGGALLAANRRINPDDPDAHRLHFNHAGNDSDSDLNALVKRFPHHAALLATQGHHMRRYGDAMRETGLDGWVGQLHAARAVLLRAYRADPTLALTYYGLGELQSQLPGTDGLAEGIASMDTAVIYERDAESLRKLARLYLRAGHTAQALGAMRSAVAFASDTESPDFDLALLENLEMLHGPVAPDAAVTATGLAWPDGATYTGPVRDSKPAGNGKYTRSNGSWYEGPFDNGVPHGQGKLVSDRGLTYEGQFERGIARGAGRLQYGHAGALVDYQGQVAHALPSGTGVLTGPSGRNEGEFLDGLPHGAHTYTPPAGPKASGTWRFGMFTWPALGDIVFTGAVSGKGERHGEGWCRPVDNPAALRACTYRDGKRID